MQTVTDKKTEETIKAAKAEFEGAQKRIERALNTTPDDKLNWSPSPTCRTPLAIVAHCAMSVEGFRGMLMGKPFPWKDIPEADKEWRESEKEYTTREAVKELLDKNCKAYVEWLDTLTPEFLASTFTLPFGDFPMDQAITFMAGHLMGHASQIDYIQTAYGDLDWHMGG